jgi:hypothetical protein
LEIQLDDNQFIEGFADDTCIGIRAKTITELERSASYVLEKVCKWAETSKLKFNPQKTQCVLFTKNYKFTDIYFMNHKLEISTQWDRIILIDIYLRERATNYFIKHGQSMDSILYE